MKFPVIIVNLKNYIYGKKTLEIVKICEKVAKKTKTNILIAVPTVDLALFKKKKNILAQHVDSFEKGAYTGFITPESINGCGIIGTLINHSEHQLDLKTIKKTIDMAKKYHLVTIVCAKDDKLALKISKFKPDMIAVEPPELIGGNISISTAKPELITKTTKKVKIPVLCGAGIKNQDDVKKSIQLGAKGILVASGVVKADNVKNALMDLVQGLK